MKTFIYWQKQSICSGNKCKKVACIICDSLDLVVNLHFQGIYAFMRDTTITKLNWKLRIPSGNIKYLVLN